MWPSPCRGRRSSCGYPSGRAKTPERSLANAGNRLVDAAGTVHTPAAPGFRIVSLVPSITELLFDLGLGAHLVGRTRFCVHPESAVDEVARVGGTKTLKMERIRALRPTHAVVNIDENTREDADELARFVPKLIVTHPLEPRDNLSLYRLLAGIFHCAEAAETLCREFEHAYAAVRNATQDLPRRRVLYLIWKDPWMTVARDTYIARTLALANWHTVGDDGVNRYPEVDMSDTLLSAVDIVLFSTEPFPFKQFHIDEFIAAHPDAPSAPALVDAEMVSWYGSRAIAGLHYLREFATQLSDI